MPKFVRALMVLTCAILTTASLYAQPLTKSAINVGSGNTKQTGQTFGYRLTYNCSSVSGPCLNATVTDLLPAAVQFVDTVPAGPAADVAAISVTNNYMGSGRTRVLFTLNTPLPAGNSGDLQIDVKFPNGSTPDGTVATNTADGTNLGPSPGTMTTPPVNVTAQAGLQATLSKTLTSSPANLDMPESYRLRISNTSNSSGSLNLTAIGPVVDTLPTGVVFNGSTPAADCQPGCVGTTPATVTWTSPCSLPLTPGNNCDIGVNVTFPSATFPSGTNVTNSFTTDGTPLGQAPTNLGIGTITHPVTTFVPSPGIGLSKGIASGSPNPPTLNQTFSYDININNNGNVPLDTLSFIDSVPAQLQVASVTTGAYSSVADFSAGVGVRVTYEKNTALNTFTLWGSSPAANTNTTLTAPPPGLGAGEYITRIKWEFGAAAVGMSASTHPQITGQIINPSHTGAPVAIGSSIQNCVDANAVYTAGPTPVNHNVCNNFTLSGPFVQLNPAKDNLSGGPFNPGQSVAWRLRVRSAAQSSDPVPLENVVAVDLLPVDLIFGSWTFDDQATGLPAPQTFEQIPNYQGTGRTLLRWRWNAGSGNLGINQQVWININTTVRQGVSAGPLANTFSLTTNGTPLGQRCSATAGADTLDLDGDGSTSDSLCSATTTATIQAIAQLISSKTIEGACDGAPSASSSGTLIGGDIRYHLHVQNNETVAMDDFVLIDILPFVGDTGVRDTTPRGTQWTPLLSAPITPPPGTTVYYSTTGNPCRGEVGGPTTACTPPNWTTVAPVPITSVRSFKVEFGNIVVGPGDALDFDYFMTTPGNVTPGTFAYNSFAYQADRADGLGSLAAEPQKVGITIGACDAATLGNYVWVDTNKDGIQNDGLTGLNDVRVELHTPGVDGIVNTTDDLTLATTVTTDSPSGQPGWYQFPGLAPGSYYVRVIPPPTFTPTTQHSTTDTLDSDGDPTTGNSGIRTLVSNQSDQDVDFGLVTDHLAALGDYVWFDRNSDGIQNESPFDGANGVTVRLFVDDGDGTPDAGDALVATTVTADDVYGRPGYYLFDKLIPGLRYYVQFIKPAAATGFTSQHTGGDSTVDSDADTVNGYSQIVILSPDEVNLTIDAGLITNSGTLALGDQVWRDNDNDGIYEPQDGEPGINNVRLDLYLDVDGDGKPTADEFIDTTLTQTDSGFDGRYRFNNLAPGNYIVVVNPINFAGSGALYGLATSTGNDPAPDPDDDVNGDDNGTNIGALIGSHPVTLTTGGEPTSEDGNSNTNLTVDFGFTPTVTPVLYYDYGDAPDVGVGTSQNNYNTTALDNGPFHLLGVSNAPYLGACVDADSGLFQNIGANADDTGEHTLVVGTCVNGDDEDGVTFTGPLTPGNTATFNVTAGGPTDCHLDAWVDWNQDGIFGNSAGEQIATNLTVPHGVAPTVLTPSVPANAIPGTTYARFRCSSAGNLPPTGPAADGEVEDYAVGIIGYDYGDAPASYGTQGAGAARHVVSPTNPLRLGQCVDTDLDGQPNAAASGDDAATGTSRAGTCLDDEDGVFFASPLVACGTSSVSVTANAAGKLDAWLDFDRNGVFDATDRIFNGVTLVAGVNTLSFSVPCTVNPGLTYSRFRLSSAGGLGPTGTAPDGEVEDYAVTTSGLDFGDAPDTYKTLLASDGPRHTVVPGYSLGATEDVEPEGQPSVGATGDGADEDGVSFSSTTLVGCTTTSLTITLTNTASINGAKLDAWIDFDGDGHFDSPRDRIASGFALVNGANTLSVPVPCDVKSGASYARFRLSSMGVSAPNGAADDGEVEDYALTLQAFDFGDAPNSYGTTTAASGAAHLIIPGFSLGAIIDAEADGQPSVGANGDGADEDGVVLPAAPLQACTSATFTVNVTNTSSQPNPRLDAWIDFDGDGTFDSPRDRVANGLAVFSGPNTLTVNVPCDAKTSSTYARFRLSSGGVSTPLGVAGSGEVEDYAVSVQALDFGDAPDTYKTTLAAGGPRHAILTGFSLGPTVDAEADGQPSVGANGDGGDEDGVTFPAGNQLETCVATNLTVNLTNAASITNPRLDAWIDFDGDGHFDDPRDRVASGTILNIGNNTLSVNVPCDTHSSNTYARFRLSSAGVSTPGGAATDGEVEDYPVTIVGLDYGDAPDPTFPTLLASNGARHRVLPTNNPTLGATVDTEPDGQQSSDATGDGADEDGVTFPAPLVAGATGAITVHTGTTGGIVSCWIDINQNGSWADAGEKVVSDATMAGSATQTFTFPVPIGTPAGTAMSRCRISTLAGLAVTGEAPDGEVEDHTVTVINEHPVLGVGECLISLHLDPEVTGWYDVALDVRLDNLGNVPLNDLNANTPLSTVFVPPAQYTVISVTSPDFVVNPAYNGAANSDLLTATGNTLQPGTGGVIHLVVRVTAGTLTGSYQSSSTGRGTSPVGTIVTDVSNDGCAVDPDGDDNPNNNNTPSAIILPPVNVPTLDPRALAILVVLLAAVALRRTT